MHLWTRLCLYFFTFFCLPNLQSLKTIDTLNIFLNIVMTKNTDIDLHVLRNHAVVAWSATVLEGMLVLRGEASIFIHICNPLLDMSSTSYRWRHYIMVMVAGPSFQEVPRGTQGEDYVIFRWHQCYYIHWRDQSNGCGQAQRRTLDT
jgi:hypothetical protein